MGLLAVRALWQVMPSRATIAVLDGSAAVRYGFGAGFGWFDWHQRWSRWLRDWFRLWFRWFRCWFRMAGPPRSKARQARAFIEKLAATILTTQGGEEGGLAVALARRNGPGGISPARTLIKPSTVNSMSRNSQLSRNCFSVQRRGSDPTMVLIQPMGCLSRTARQAS